MKSLLFCALSATSLLACAVDEADTSDTEQTLSTELNWTHKNLPKGFARPGGGGHAVLLTNHGGPTITNAKVVTIFWGSDWNGSSIAASIQNFVGVFGTTGEYHVITEYSGIQQGSLGNVSWTDTSTPPTAVTDAAIQAEVLKYLNGTAPDASTIYEVFLPKGSYSSDGTSTSCGGPHLGYCAYHGNFANNGNDIKYASMPYPSCGGCTTAGFTDTQNFEHFISHETREAVTDPDGTAWFDKSGNEADDKCAWTPTPTTDASTGSNADGSPFAYQYEWSNAAAGCVLKN